MTDSNESKLGATEDDGADFEGQKLGGPEKIGKLGDKIGAADDDSPDFEGHKLGSPEKIGKLGDKLG